MKGRFKTLKVKDVHQKSKSGESNSESREKGGSFIHLFIHSLNWNLESNGLCNRVGNHIFPARPDTYMGPKI
jgi:hypothetical protein